MLPPTSRFIVAWSALLLALDLTYTAILLPLALAFRLNANPGWLLMSLLVGFLFTADLGVMLHRWGGRGAGRHCPPPRTQRAPAPLPPCACACAGRGADVCPPARPPAPRAPRGVVVKWMNKLLYVDSFRDVAYCYAHYGDFWLALPVALSAPAQLAAALLRDAGDMSDREMGSVQVGPRARQACGLAAGPAVGAAFAAGGGLAGAGRRVPAAAACRRARAPTPARPRARAQILVLVRGLRLVRLLVLQRQLFFGRPAVRRAARPHTAHPRAPTQRLLTPLHRARSTPPPPPPPHTAPSTRPPPPPGTRCATCRPTS